MRAGCIRSLRRGSVRARSARRASRSSASATSSKSSTGGKIVETSFTDCFHASRFGERRLILSGEASGDYQARAAERWAKVWYSPIIPERMISMGERPPKRGAVFARATQPFLLSSLCGKRTLIAA